MKTYTTRQGDMWDIIALRVYGKEKYLSFLLKANPRYINVYIFDAGTVLNCPTCRRRKSKPHRHGGNDMSDVIRVGKISALYPEEGTARVIYEDLTDQQENPAVSPPNSSPIRVRRACPSRAGHHRGESPVPSPYIGTPRR